VYTAGIRADNVEFEAEFFHLFYQVVFELRSTNLSGLVFREVNTPRNIPFASMRPLETVAASAAGAK
jgi:hypothetical protein